MFEAAIQALEKEFKALGKHWIVMIETSPENYSEVSLKALELLSKQGLIPIVLSTNRPCTTLINQYEEKGMKSEDVNLLCCVCASQGGATKELANVKHLPSVNALTEIALGVNEAIKTAHEKHCFYLDSVSSMLIHNNPQDLIKFIHGILIRIRMRNMTGVLITSEKQSDETVRAQLVQLCDKVIKV